MEDDDEGGEDGVGVAVIWNRAERLGVWASLLIWWAEAMEGLFGASACKVMGRPICVKDMVRVW